MKHKCRGINIEYGGQHVCIIQYPSKGATQCLNQKRPYEYKNICWRPSRYGKAGEAAKRDGLKSGTVQCYIGLFVTSKYSIRSYFHLQDWKISAAILIFGPQQEQKWLAMTMRSREGGQGSKRVTHISPVFCFRGRTKHGRLERRRWWLTGLPWVKGGFDFAQAVNSEHSLFWVFRRFSSIYQEMFFFLLRSSFVSWPSRACVCVLRLVLTTVKDWLRVKS